MGVTLWGVRKRWIPLSKLSTDLFTICKRIYKRINKTRSNKMSLINNWYHPLHMCVGYVYVYKVRWSRNSVSRQIWINRSKLSWQTRWNWTLCSVKTAIWIKPCNRATVWWKQSSDRNSRCNSTHCVAYCKKTGLFLIHSFFLYSSVLILFILSSVRHLYVIFPSTHPIVRKNWYSFGILFIYCITIKGNFFQCILETQKISSNINTNQ